VTTTELHRINSRAWYSVDAVVRPDDALRFDEEQMALGGENARLMGGSVDRFLQLQGRWLAFYRGKHRAHPWSPEARRRLWRSTAMQANHQRFVRVALTHFAVTTRPTDERRPEWYDALEQTLSEWSWMVVCREKLVRYLRRAAALDLKRRSYADTDGPPLLSLDAPVDDSDDADLHDLVSDRNLEGNPRASIMDEMLEEEEIATFAACVRKARSQTRARVEIAVYDRLEAFLESSIEQRISVRDVADELDRILDAAKDRTYAQRQVLDRLRSLRKPA
jgi:hypothetical protein